ncbi:hypothetical protein ACOMHN_002840 [Nucella lapillus]
MTQSVSSKAGGLEQQGGWPGAARRVAWSSKAGGLEQQGGWPGAARRVAWSSKAGGLEQQGGWPGAARRVAWSSKAGGLEQQSQDINPGHCDPHHPPLHGLNRRTSPLDTVTHTTHLFMASTEGHHPWTL